MGKAKLGGTKGKLRGKVGSDIYQLKRDPNGTLIQSVYEQNPNPKYTNTEKQAKNRCIMGQIERMWHWLPSIIKDAWCNVPRGTLSFQHFSKINYAQVKEDFETHFDGDPEFDWQSKRQMYAPAGPWFLTDGTLPEVTWDNAVCALNWNNGVGLEWNYTSMNPTYGDFLDLFGLKHGDRLVLVIFRQDFNGEFGYVETWSFWPREDYTVETDWMEVDDEHVFKTNCPYSVLSAYSGYTGKFYFDIDTQDYPKVIKIACFTFFIVRPSDRGTLFSSSHFHWAQKPVPYGYKRRNPAQVWDSWLNE